MSAFEVERDGKRVTIYDPLPHQQAFHASTHRYTLMSGGRGSGKSLAMRMEAYMMGFAIPGFKALIMRRSAPELKNSHLMEVPRELAKMGLPPEAFHVTDMRVRLPNHSMVQFGHLEDDKALTKLLSSQWECVLLDEISTFSYVQFSWMLTSLRTTIPGLIPYAKAASNPVGPGAGFVRDLWITKAAAKKPEKYPGYNPDDYFNIHCNLDDNPHVNPTEYAKTFAGIPSKATREALRHGIWAIEGQFFEQWQEARDGRPWHVIDKLPAFNHITAPYAPGIEVFRAIDWGYKECGVCLWFAALPDGSLVVVDELVFEGMLPREVADEIKRRSQGMKIRYTVADPAMWAEHEGPSIAEHFELAGVPMIEGDRNRKPGWVTVHTWLSETLDDGTGERPKLQVYRANCPYLVQTLPEMVVDERDPEDMKTKHVDDHACFVAGTTVLTSIGDVPIEHITAGDQVWTRHGLRTVRIAARTGQKPVYELGTMGHSVVATADHPFWTNTGWRSLDQLKPGDSVWRWSGEASSSFDLANPTHPSRIDPTGRLTSLSAAKAWAISTANSGLRRLGRFLKAGTSTTETGTLSTTGSATSKPCPARSTAEPIEDVRVSPQARKRSKRLERGARLQRAWRSTRSWAESLGKLASLWVGSADSVGLGILRAGVGPAAAFVAMPASLPFDGRLARTMRRDGAPGAASSSARTSTATRSVAPVTADVVTHTRYVGTQEVYSLSVEETPEFFANGYLVHNCDALRYGLQSRPTASRLPVNTELSWVRRQMLKDRPLGARLGSEATRTY